MTAGPDGVHTGVVFSRVPGQGRYAHLEREQRWALGELPASRRDPVEIRDRYLDTTRLRARRMQSGSEVVFKLCQKVRDREDSPELVRITNIYLDEAEFAVVSSLPGRTLAKTRWRWDVAGHIFAVDEFHGDLDGLVLAETELGPDDPWKDAPPGARADVTFDDRFSGGSLATLTRSSVTDLLNWVDGCDLT